MLPETFCGLTGPMVSMAGRGFLSPETWVSGPLLGLLLGGFSPPRAKFLPCSKISSIFGSLWVGVAGIAWCHLWLGPHAWTPVALGICRRNTKWEGVQRELHGCKTRFCSRNINFFPSDFYQVSRNVNSQKFGNNWYFSFHPEFAPPVSLLSSSISSLKTDFTLKSETIYSQICSY